MVATTWVVPSAVFFTSIIGWQYFVGYRSVPVGKCYVQYMDSPIFNCLLQLGYFWATLVVMCALYTGIYRVALRLHRESAARRHNMAVVTAHATQRLGPTSSTMSTTAYKFVATATVSAARDHAQRGNDRTTVGLAPVAGGLSDSSQSEHDLVSERRHHDTNDVTLLLSHPSRRRSELAIELREMSQLDTTSTAMTFTVDDDNIRFADDVTDDDDDVVFPDRQTNWTCENDTNLHHHHQHHHHSHHQLQQQQQKQQQQQSEHVSSRDLASRSLLSSAPEEFDMHRHSAEHRQLARVDTTGVPTRRRFYSHQRLSSRRRQRRSKATCEWHTSRPGSQVIDKLSASLHHFTQLTHSLTDSLAAAFFSVAA